MRFIDVFDNTKKNRKLSRGWGLSFFFPDYHLLFDTGESPIYLEQNLHELGISKDEIAYIFLSHEHWDHTGGMDIFRDEKRTVFLHSHFTEDSAEMYRAMGLNVEVIEKPFEILPEVYSTGPLGNVIKEHSLIIETKEGLCVFTGCSHPGLEDILDSTRKFGTRIRLVAGGFHLLDMNKEQIEGVIDLFKKYRVEKVAPTHCTGELAIEMFHDEFGEDFIELGAGLEVEI
ncbi:MBL fold metallo-hydrolase [bacterium]|nr:MAG: MBL fold metallo-hydrolase [bacterium]